MKKLPTLFSLLAVLFCHALQAGPYYSFEHYTTYDGLPSNTIHCTYQDRFGFVWIGTRDGLSRFDGYDFRSPGGPYGTGMTHLASMDLEEDEDGLLWFTTSDGVGYYNPFTGHTHDVGRLGQALVVHHGHIGREEHALEVEVVVEGLREREDVVVRLGRGTHDELR